MSLIEVPFRRDRGKPPLSPGRADPLLGEQCEAFARRIDDFFAKNWLLKRIAMQAVAAVFEKEVKRFYREQPTLYVQPRHSEWLRNEQAEKSRYRKLGHQRHSGSGSVRLLRRSQFRS